MAFGPAHMEQVREISSQIAHTAGRLRPTTTAGEVLDDHLESLYGNNGRICLESIGEPTRLKVATEEVGLAAPEFPTATAVDSGTVNPIQFKNGLVVSFSHAAMAATPTDIDLHRSRTMIATVHTTDRTVDYSTDWRVFDDGHGRWRIVQTPRVPGAAAELAHELALSLAETGHTLEHASAIDDLLIQDGPIYPRHLLPRESPNSGDSAPATRLPKQAVRDAVRLVEQLARRKIPVVGFVKNPESRRIVRALEAAGVTGGWQTDAGFFTELLAPDPQRGRRPTDILTFSNWFRLRAGPDGTMTTPGANLDVERRLAPSDYEVTFFMLYDPRMDLLYRVEAPYCVSKDPVLRERIQLQVLRSVATECGPPGVVGKADSLARISNAVRDDLTRRLARQFDTSILRSYDETRWG